MNKCPNLAIAATVCILTGCASMSQSRLDANFRPAVDKAASLESAMPFSGKPLWENHIQFVIQDAKVQDVALPVLQGMFDAKGIATTKKELEQVSNFIAVLAQNPAPYKGKTIDLALVLKELRRK